ncbi:60S ribosomal protein L7a-1 [Canna indica]|uniref:60S ribosomal protein L7a n=1 Tax=Canna indica TaxID=4628 RepID=A0AAQ3JYV6_9LILI|nr:60S ribosomal protein L7a-1 [Canna indica]
MGRGKVFPAKRHRPAIPSQALWLLPPLMKFPSLVPLINESCWKKERLLKRAQAKAEGKTVEVKKPIVVTYGLNHVTYLIEQNKAQPVIITHDVDPIELVVWLAALCRKMEIPYCIVKGKARLGAIVYKKTTSVLCLTTVKNEDKLEFSKILEDIKANFSDKFDEIRRKWGGGIMSSKSQEKTKAKEKVLAKEATQRMS